MTIATRNRGNFPLVETMGQVWGVSGQQKMIVGNIKKWQPFCVAHLCRNAALSFLGAVSKRTAKQVYSGEQSTPNRWAAQLAVKHLRQCLNAHYQLMVTEISQEAGTQTHTHTHTFLAGCIASILKFLSLSHQKKVKEGQFHLIKADRCTLYCNRMCSTFKFCFRKQQKQVHLVCQLARKRSVHFANEDLVTVIEIVKCTEKCSVKQAYLLI